VNNRGASVLVRKYLIWRQSVPVIKGVGVGVNRHDDWIRMDGG